MRLARPLAGVGLLATLTLLAAGATQSQEKSKSGDGPVTPAGRDRLPKFWDQLGLTYAQRAEVLKLTAEQRQRRGQADGRGPETGRGVRPKAGRDPQ
jgi:Spy/CpxP family protein refolding chaperone